MLKGLHLCLEQIEYKPYRRSIGGLTGSGSRLDYHYSIKWDPECDRPKWAQKLPIEYKCIKAWTELDEFYRALLRELSETAINLTGYQLPEPDVADKWFVSIASAGDLGCVKRKSSNKFLPHSNAYEEKWNLKELHDDRLRAINKFLQTALYKIYLVECETNFKFESDALKAFLARNITVQPDRPPGSFLGKIPHRPRTAPEDKQLDPLKALREQNANNGNEEPGSPSSACSPASPTSTKLSFDPKLSVSKSTPNLSMDWIMSYKTPKGGNWKPRDKHFSKKDKYSLKNTTWGGEHFRLLVQCGKKENSPDHYDALKEKYKKSLGRYAMVSPYAMKVQGLNTIIDEQVTTNDLIEFPTDDSGQFSPKEIAKLDDGMSIGSVSPKNHISNLTKLMEEEERKNAKKHANEKIACLKNLIQTGKTTEDLLRPPETPPIKGLRRNLNKKSTENIETVQPARSAESIQAKKARAVRDTTITFWMLVFGNEFTLDSSFNKDQLTMAESKHEVFAIAKFHKGLALMEMHSEAEHQKDQGKLHVKLEHCITPMNDPEDPWPIRWVTMLDYFQKEKKFAQDQKLNRLCTTAIGCLRYWRKNDFLKKKYHLGLTRTICWFYPKATAESLSIMLRWIAATELDKLRLRSPPSIPQDEERQLQDLFNALDDDGSGTCSAEELVTQSVPGMKPILDIETVHLVCGKGELNLNQFFEFMCQDGFLAHKDAMVSYRQGVELKRLIKKNIPWEGWILSDPPQDLRVKYALIEQLEKGAMSLNLNTCRKSSQYQIMHPEKQKKTLLPRMQDPKTEGGKLGGLFGRGGLNIANVVLGAMIKEL